MKNKILFLVLSFFLQLQAQDVFQIARNGTVAEMKALSDKNPKVINEVSPEGYTPLILAVYNNNVEVAEFLIEKGADVNGNSKMGTPLMAAVVKNNQKCVEILLKNKADVSISDANGSTALHYAVMFKQEILIKLLIENKADINQKDQRNLSPLDYAMMTKDEKILNLLK
jgi:ankyrin repeat protein